MKKVLAKLKRVNKLIAETETEIKNINDASGLFYKAGEKAHELSKLNHFLGEIKESKAKILSELIEVSKSELEILNHAKAA